jgi:hypothetical protein
VTDLSTDDPVDIAKTMHEAYIPRYGATCVEIRLPAHDESTEGDRD